MKQVVIKHPDRPEAERVWKFPLPAIEEAVVNPVYHRFYEIREPIEIRISRDDIAILSFPGPDRSIRLADLSVGKAVSRRYRNRRIGEFLKELELTEGRSTGISKILKVMKSNGSPSPEFDTDEDRSYFLTRLPIHSSALLDNMRGQDTPHVTPHVTPQATPQATPQVERLLAVSQGESLRETLQARLGLVAKVGGLSAKLRLEREDRAKRLWDRIEPPTTLCRVLARDPRREESDCRV